MQTCSEGICEDKHVQNHLNGCLHICLHCMSAYTPMQPYLNLFWQVQSEESLALLCFLVCACARMMHLAELRKWCIQIRSNSTALRGQASIHEPPRSRDLLRVCEVGHAPGARDDKRGAPCREHSLLGLGVLQRSLSRFPSSRRKICD